MAAIIDRKIDVWKKKLLDLGMRNRLLNYRDTKRSTLNITTPELSSLYKMLVINEKELTLPRVELQSILSEDEDGPKITPVEIKGDLGTDRSGKETLLVAKNLRDKARTANEEQGVNILYASFGFLEWSENGKASSTVFSPIILVPVVLSHDSITDPYVLSLHEDEILFNPTLAYKLENDYNMVFPEFDSQSSIAEYLETVSQIVSKNGWTVHSRVSISLLSFLKINMYKDLDRRYDIITKNNIIRAIAGYKVQSDFDFNEMAGYDHDAKDRPIDTYQVVDADSSQLDAIVMSKRGASFVLQGPPGTGKSQTITNIIAEGLADGKKILFVSEKMAALDVVYNRLEHSNLSDFCLVLHSNKANKRELLDSLRKVLDLKDIQVTNDAIRTLRSLEDKKKELNTYCEELHRIIPPLNQSVFEANGIIAGLIGTPDISFDYDRISMDRITREDLYNLQQTISVLARTIENMPDGIEDNVWNGTTIKRLSHEKRNEILSLFSEVDDKVTEFIEAYDPFCVQLFLDKDISYSDLFSLSEAMHYAATSPTFPKEWINEFNKDKLLSDLDDAYNHYVQINSIKDGLDSDYGSDIYGLEAGLLLEDVEKNYKKYRKKVSLKITKEEYLVGLENSERVFRGCINDFNVLGETIENIRQYIRINNVTEYKHIEDLYKFIECFDSDIRPHECWFDAEWKDHNNRNSVMNTARGLFEKYRSQREKLLAEYDKDILDIDYAEMLKRCRTEYTSVLRFLNSRFREDCKLIRSLKKVPVKSLKYEELMAVVDDVRIYKEYEGQIQENNEQFALFFGGWFDEENTDIQDVSRAWDSFSKILAYYDYSVPEEVKIYLLRGDNVNLLADNYGIISDFFACDYVPRFEEITGLDRNRSDLIKQIKDLQDLLNINLQAQSIIRKISDCAVSAKGNDGYVADLETLSSYQNTCSEFDSIGDKLKGEIFDLYQGLDTQWTDVTSTINWFDSYESYRKQCELSDEFSKLIAVDPNMVILCDNLAGYIDNYVAANDGTFREFDSLFEYDVLSLPFSGLRGKALICSEKINDLESWMDFANSRNKCKEIGLESFVDTVLARNVPTDQIENVFMKRFERQWLDYAMAQLPSVESFRTRHQEKVISDFRRLDVEQFKISQLRVREKLLKKVPDSNSFTSANDELGILKHELNKQRRIMPVRKLFDNIPNLLPCLKPCLMMSPLSVSQYLQTENYLFDMVIFDEASQVRTENAIGAISRAKQVIIAGDIHQLPPTNFFSSSISGSDEYDEDEDDTDAYESVLEEANTVLPQLTLRWHYRSRDESLIAFSNAKIYNNSLVTFPSPSDDADKDGVEFFYVEDGIYNRSTKRNNPLEAKKVADLVFETIKTCPGRSIGVITFSEAQQSCVEDEILRRRLADPSYEYFFNSETEEPFFIKNLENVQGDERDTIIFSVGYGKSAPRGEVHMNFGPLNKSGGYRRLNVAITRAKYNVKLVCSFLPTEMSITEATPKGVKLLADYMSYAKNGYSYLQNELKVSDEIMTESPFEQSVYDFLVSKGYNVSTQVGCSGYRIDLGIRHPSLNGVFVLGVECDGATYHSSRTARERDRLRQSVLESMGWSIYRIWSTDWIKDPVTERAKLVTAIEAAIKHYDDPNEVSFEQKQISADYYVEFERHDREGYGFTLYEERTYKRSATEQTLPVIAAAVDQIVKDLSPIHFQYVARQIAPLLCNIKVTNKVVDALGSIIDLYSRRYGWVFVDGYFWNKADMYPQPKVPEDMDPLRDLDKIAPEELCEAMRLIISKSYGIEKDALFKVVTVEYGFARCTASMEKSLEIAYKLLLRSKKVKCIDGKHSSV